MAFLRSNRMLPVIVSLAMLAAPLGAMAQEEGSTGSRPEAAQSEPDIEETNAINAEPANGAGTGLDNSGEAAIVERAPASESEQTAGTSLPDDESSMMDLVPTGLAILFALALLAGLFILGRRVSAMRDHLDQLSKSHKNLKHTHAETQSRVMEIERDLPELAKILQRHDKSLSARPAQAPRPTASSPVDRAPQSSQPIARPEPAQQVPTDRLRGLIEAAKGMTQSEYRARAGEIGQVHLLNMTGDGLQIHPGEDDGDARDLLGIRLSPERIAVVPSMQFIDRFDQSRSAKKSERIQPYFDLHKSDNPSLELLDTCVAYDDDGMLRIEQKGQLTGFSD